MKTLASPSLKKLRQIASLSALVERTDFQAHSASQANVIGSPSLLHRLAVEDFGPITSVPFVYRPPKARHAHPPMPQ